MKSTEALDDVPIDELDAQLVAYLDGELEDRQRAMLEERLMEDADCKKRLRELQQSFDMLDCLPSPAVNKDFARTTVELVTISASQELEVVKQQRPWKYIGYAATLVVATALSGASGILTIRSTQKAQERSELEGLAVAENLLAYKQIETDADLQFFARLASDKTWQDSIAIARRLAELPDHNTSERLSATQIGERIGRVEQMQPQAKRELQIQYERFVAQSPEQQASMAAIARKIESLEEADLIISTLVTYVDWIDKLPNSVRSELQAASSSKRMELVSKILSSNRRSGIEFLTKDDIDNLYECALESSKAAVPRESDSRSKWRDIWTERMLPDSNMSRDEKHAHLRLWGAHRSTIDGAFQSFGQMFSDQEKQQLVDILSPAAASELAKIEDSKQRDARLSQWLSYAIAKRTPVRAVARVSFQDYEAMEDSARERFDLRNPSDALRSLRTGFGGGGPRGGGPSFRGRSIKGKRPPFDFEGPPGSPHMPSELRPPAEGNAGQRDSAVGR